MKEQRHPHRLAHTAPGFSLIELIVSMAIFSLLAVTVFSIAVETTAFLGDQDSELQMQLDADRAFQKLSEILRKSGRIAEAGIAYPRVLSTGGLQFKILVDGDGNGYAFEAATGDLEWDPRVFTVQRDAATDVLSVYSGGVPVLPLSRHITGLDFYTFLEDPSLNLKEIRVNIVARRETHRGDPITFTRAGSIYLRN